MTIDGGGYAVLPEKNSLRREKFRNLLYSDPEISINQDNNNNDSRRASNASMPSSRFHDKSSSSSGNSTPANFMSPWNQPSPYIKSPWTHELSLSLNHYDDISNYRQNGLIMSLVREEGHIYSLAASENLLFTGSDSKNIRVWKNLKEFSGFKSNSGLVKAIVISGDKIFTGHQDGKIRVWKFSRKTASKYKRVSSLPTTKDYFKTSINPKNYVEVRRNRKVPWIKHFDAVSCMSLDEENGLLYSSSWDKTLKVWRLSDFKCLESIKVHDDAVNSVVVGFYGLVFTGSADGTVKVWRRELMGKVTRHVLVQTLLKHEYAVTAVVVNSVTAVVYGGSSDGLVNYWELEKHSLAYGGVLRGHKLAILCMAVAGNLVLSGSADKSICVWRREEGGDHMCLSVLTGHGGPVKCLAVEEEDGGGEDKEDQRWILYSGSLDKSVKVWRVVEHAPELKQLHEV